VILPLDIFVHSVLPACDKQTDRQIRSNSTEKIKCNKNFQTSLNHTQIQF